MFTKIKLRTSEILLDPIFNKCCVSKQMCSNSRKRVKLMDSIEEKYNKDIDIVNLIQ